MNIRAFYALCAMLVPLYGGTNLYGQRSEILLEKDWKFIRDDSVEFSDPGYDDSGWQDVTVPHDWAIWGPFNEWNDRQHVAIMQDGQTEALEHAGRTGGLPFAGTGWYRTEFDVPDLSDGRRCSLVFDGAMSHAQVWINGREVCFWPYGYNSFHFDATPYVREGMNSPAIVMWCIGNEVPDQADWDNGPKLALMLQDICHREDPTRPVTQGMENQQAVTTNGMAAVMDIPGFNYKPDKYSENYARLPQRLVLGSETVSAVSSRGVYKFPVERRSMQKYPDHQSSSYDLEHCAWSNLPEDDFIQQEDLPYTIGEFVWTGFDYLGEPTPYYSDWPSHSSLFGIIDLAGIPKDRYWLYRSHWNREAETLHILPHWNWEGREGEVTPVFVYTNHPSAELFINGKSQGIRTKDTTVTVLNSADSVSMAELKRQSRYRLMWMDTVYEPGTVKAVAYDAEGNPVAEKEMHTAGKPYGIELSADRDTIMADGRDLSFITVKVTDREGNLCPLADNEIVFKVKGNGWYRAGANGDPTSLDPFQRPRMKVFSGMMTAIVSSTEEPGEIILEADSKGLKKAVIRIRSVLSE